VGNALCEVSFNFPQRSLVAVILLQYILIKFPSVDFDHPQIFAVTSDMLSNKDLLGLTKDNISAIFNLWIIGSAVSPVYDLGQLDQFSFQDLVGYNARVFGIAIRMKVKELVERIKSCDTSKEQIWENLLKVTYLLKKSAEFLKASEGHQK
jgi:hypothetical protein